MKVRQSILMLVIAIFGTACAGPSREDNKKIKILEKKELAKCRPIELVVGENEKGSEALAIEATKKAALDLEADAIFIQSSVNNGASYKVEAMAYSCKN